MMAQKDNRRPEEAVSRFSKSMNCCQAILTSYMPEELLSEETAKRLSSPFGGGMGIGSECGAVTGALMVIGLNYGAKTKETNRYATELIDVFRSVHEETACSKLLGLDMSTKEGIKKAIEKGYFKSRCPVFIRTAAEILEGILGRGNTS